jgi:nicotinamidase-related amidase
MTDQENTMSAPADAALLLIDHQSGLFRTIADMTFNQVRSHAAALAKMATLVKIPVITTASVPQGPNGPTVNACPMHKLLTGEVRIQTELTS